MGTAQRRHAGGRNAPPHPPTAPGAATPPTLKGALRAQRTIFYQAAAISVPVNALMLTGPLFMLQVYDRVLASGSLPTLTTLFGLTAALFAFYGLFDTLRGRLLARAGARLQATVEREALQASVGAGAGPQSARAVRDLETLQQLLSGPAPGAALDLPWSPAFFALIFVFHTELGILACAGALTLTGLAIANAGLSTAGAGAAREHSGEAERVERALRINHEAVRALGMLGAVTERWAAPRRRALAAQIGASDRTGAFAGASKALRLALQSAILAWGAWLAIDGLISPGMIIAASIMAGRALAPIDQVIGQWWTYTGALCAWRNLSQILTHHQAPAAPTALPPLRGHVRARALAVAAPGATPGTAIVRNLSFEVSPGQALAVIGPTGAGKSALARTLVGAWAPAHGTLTLDGAAHTQWAPETLGRQIGYLPQEVSILDATIAENIARLDANADDADIVEAAQRAGAHGLIVALESGYDTPAGAHGSQLSGGQRQRIGLARALYGDPALLVLDEPNAHLDAEGEAALGEAVERLKANTKTVIVMAHRPSIVAACDLALVLGEHGQRAFGPTQEVLARTTEHAPVTALRRTADG